MFEQFVSDLLVRYLHLDDYIKGLDSKHLTIALWNGDVTLENLKLRKKSLNKLDLPIVVKGGTIGKLRLKVPWHNISNERIIITFEKIFLIVGPKVLSQMTLEEIEKQELQKKKNHLELAEILKKEQQQEREQTEKQGGTFTSYFTKIVDNIQFTIKDLHIRYEDEVAATPFTFGVTLEEVSAVSADERWKPAFLTQEHKLIHKLVSLKNLALYWNPNEPPLKFETVAEMARLLEKLISRGEKTEKSTTSSNHYVLSPVNGSLKLILNKSNIPDKQNPKFTFNFEFDDIAFALEEQQYRELIHLADWFNFYAKTEQYRKFPRPSVRPMEDPKAWWRFAQTCIRSDVAKKTKFWKKEVLDERRKHRLDYITFYKAKLRKRNAPKLKEDPTENQRLDELEKVLGVEDILFFRASAEAQLRLEEAQLKSSSKQVEQQKEASSNRGWVSWIWGGYSGVGNNKEAIIEDAPLVEFTAEQKREFFASVDYDRQANPGGSLEEKDYVRMVFNFKMKNGSITLRATKGLLDIVSANFIGFDLALKNRPDSMTLNASLHTLELFDRYTPNTVFSRLISPIQSGSDQSRTEPVFSMLFEHNPLDSNYNYRLNLQMLPLEIVISKMWLDNIQNFFSAATDSTTLQEIEAAAQTHMKELRSKTASRFVEELENHKTLDLNINISAPKILLPETLADENTAMIVVDLGNLFIKSTPQEQNLLDNNDKYLSRTEREFYDRFTISMNTMQLMLTKKSEHKVKAPTQLVDKFDINVALYYCIKTDVTLTKLKIYADLPVLQIQLSRDKIIKILKVLGSLLKTLEFAPVQNPNFLPEQQLQLQRLLGKKQTNATVYL